MDCPFNMVDPIRFRSHPTALLILFIISWSFSTSPLFFSEFSYTVLKSFSYTIAKTCFSAFGNTDSVSSGIEVSVVDSRLR